MYWKSTVADTEAFTVLIFLKTVHVFSFTLHLAFSFRKENKNRGKTEDTCDKHVDLVYTVW